MHSDRGVSLRNCTGQLIKSGRGRSFKVLGRILKRKDVNDLLLPLNTSSSSISNNGGYSHTIPDFDFDSSPMPY